jgi:HK97 family phage major capsid protein
MILAGSDVVGENGFAKAAARWGAAQADTITKAVVGGVTSGSMGEVASEFLGLVREQSLIGRMSGLRRVPFNTRMLKLTSGAIGYWVSESKPMPISRPSIDGASLDPLRVAAIVVTTKEALASQYPLAETTLQEDLQRAVTGALDLAFADPDNAGIPGQTPASITHGAPTITASGDLQDDIAQLVAAFQGDLQAAYFTTDPVTATRLALATDAGGRYLFPEVGPRGGALLGIPLLVSRHVPVGTGGGRLALIDPTGIAANVDALEISRSEHTSLLMSDDPANDPGTLVSLWQTDSVALKVSVRANFEVQRAGAVAVLEGI